LADLDARLDDALEQKNNFLAVRVDGRFAAITLRSVHRQEPPYRPLADVVKGQSVWTLKEVSGTLVGVRSPAWVAGLNVPGYHWHFLSDDRTVGGHVLDCRVREGRVQYEVCPDWLIKLDGRRRDRPSPVKPGKTAPSGASNLEGSAMGRVSGKVAIVT